MIIAFAKNTPFTQTSSTASARQQHRVEHTDTEQHPDTEHIQIQNIYCQQFTSLLTLIREKLQLKFTMHGI